MEKLVGPGTAQPAAGRAPRSRETAGVSWGVRRGNNPGSRGKSFPSRLLSPAMLSQPGLRLISYYQTAPNPPSTGCQGIQEVGLSYDPNIQTGCRGGSVRRCRGPTGALAGRSPLLLRSRGTPEPSSRTPSRIAPPSFESVQAKADRSIRPSQVRANPAAGEQALHAGDGPGPKVFRRLGRTPQPLADLTERKGLEAAKFDHQLFVRGQALQRRHAPRPGFHGRLRGPRCLVVVDRLDKLETVVERPFSAERALAGFTIPPNPVCETTDQDAGNQNRRSSTLWPWKRAKQRHASSSVS